MSLVASEYNDPSTSGANGDGDGHCTSALSPSNKAKRSRTLPSWMQTLPQGGQSLGSSSPSPSKKKKKENDSKVKTQDLHKVDNMEDDKLEAEVVDSSSRTNNSSSSKSTDNIVEETKDVYIGSVFTTITTTHAISDDSDEDVSDINQTKDVVPEQNGIDDDVKNSVIIQTKDPNSSNSEKKDSENVQQDQSVDDNQSTSTNTGDGTQVSSADAPREPCRYGKKCYRKNPEHLKEFSHPGDKDYDTTNSDARPECAYGTSCYRKNPLHRQHYNHTKKIRKAALKRPQKESGSSDDDYDYDDPFLNDGSSEDYQPTDSDSGSDFSNNDPGADDEEKKESKRMKKEAKKFVKKKK